MSSEQGREQAPLARWEDVARQTNAALEGQRQHSATLSRQLAESLAEVERLRKCDAASRRLYELARDGYAEVARERDWLLVAVRAAADDHDDEAVRRWAKWVLVAHLADFGNEPATAGNAADRSSTAHPHGAAPITHHHTLPPDR